ncbi:MAG: hypothetical protein LYZ66_03675 [Nitrososphaerales archaeon]|nr:hypothetical protein [Nitrososphaerales archaeon]
MKVITWITLFVLFAQFPLGMWLNLFASFPTSSPSLSGMAGMMSSMMGFMMTGGMSVLMVHMFIGFVLLITSVITLGIASYSGERRAIMLSGLGLVSIIVAGVGGLSFMFSGFQDSFLSYLMAIGFLSAFTVYFVILYVAKSNHRS